MYNINFTILQFYPTAPGNNYSTVCLYEFGYSSTG